MADVNFEAVMQHVFRHEGGYVDHPKDPGGATNMGITFATLQGWYNRPITKQDVKNLPKEIALEIYRARYWKLIRGASLPAGLDLVAMDGAVNSGPVRGAKWLQKGLGRGVAIDGKIGPLTLHAARKHPDLEDVIRRACGARMSFLEGLRHWKTFGRGWSRRVADVEASAISMLLSTTSYRLKEAAKKAKRDETTTTTTAGGTAATGAGLPVATDLPQYGGWVVGAVAVLICAALLWKSLHHRNRVAALSKAAKEKKV